MAKIEADAKAQFQADKAAAAEAQAALGTWVSWVGRGGRAGFEWGRRRTRNLWEAVSGRPATTNGELVRC